VDPEALERLTRILQLSIAPVALISGVGLLLLSMTNRLGRVIDRARALRRQDATPVRADLTDAERTERDTEQGEMRALWRRARFLQTAIALIAIAIFFAVLMIAALFTMYVRGTALGTVVLTLFGACLACLATSMSFFLGDVFLSIRWLRVGMGQDRPGG